MYLTHMEINVSKGLIENLARVCTKAVFKANSSTITEMALREGASKGIILLEEFSNDDANNSDSTHSGLMLRPKLEINRFLRRPVMVK